MKTKLVLYLTIFLTTISVSGCIWIDDLLQTPQQKWITIEDDSLLWTGRTLHMRIYEGVIWEKGNEALEVAGQIDKTLIIKIDDSILPKDRYLLLTTLQFPQEVLDKYGQRLGSHYDSIDIYVGQLNLSNGHHKLYVEISSLSGVQFTYSQNFTVHSP